MESSKVKKYDAIFMIARELYSCQPTWMEFFFAICGKDGIIFQMFTTTEDRQEFFDSEDYIEIQSMLFNLKTVELAEENEISKDGRAMTVRLPVSLHKELKREAAANGVTLNKHVVSKLKEEAEEKESRCFNMVHFDLDPPPEDFFILN